MSYNGSGTFLINSAGQPVVANTVISATVFNALTSDLATGLSTAITKDGQTTITANIPFGSNKITGLGSGTAATDAANLGQVQSTAAKLVTVTGTDTITGSMSPQLTAYAAGQLFYFVAAGANTGAVTINIDGLGAKSVTRDGSTALANGDINSGEVVVLVYDGTRFQMINAANSFGNTTINGTLTVTGNTGLQANVSITSALSVGGTFAVTGAATLGSTLAVTGKSDLPTVSTASINAAVALITTGTVTNLTSTSASVASINAAVALITTGTITALTATGASVASANVGTAVVTGLTVTNASIASLNAGTATVTSGNLTFSGTAQRITGDFSNATLSNRPSFQTSTTNGNTTVHVLPNGTATFTAFRAFNNSDPTNAAFIEIQANATETRLNSNVSGTGTALPLTFFCAGAERMRLTTAGDLGLGTTSPSGKLQVTAANTRVRFSNTAGTASTLLFGADSGETFLGTETNGPIYFITNAVERLRIDAAGNVGIGGTAGATTKLDVLGTLPSSSNTSLGLNVRGTIPSSSTGFALSYQSNTSVENASFTLTNWIHFGAYQGTKGASATVTNQFGFLVDSSLTGATNNYGFYSAIASGSNRWNFYAAGTAANYFAGNTGVGITNGGTYGVFGVGGTGYQASFVQSSDASGAVGYIAANSTSEVRVGSLSNHPVRFFVNGNEFAQIDTAGNFVVNTAAIATNAANGFLYVPSCAGTPTGTPTTYTGRVPIVVDTTNNKLYFYSSGAWRDAGP